MPLVAAVALAMASPLASADNPLIQGKAHDRTQILRANADRAMPHLIQFTGPSLMAAARDALVPATSDDGRLDVDAPAAQAWVAELRMRQDALMRDARQLLGRELVPVNTQFQFQHAFNGMAARLTPAEARALADMPGIERISPMRVVPVATDRGPQLIGAANIWSGILDGVDDRLFATGFDAPGVLANRGEGTVIGVVDTGLNFDSPSFTAQAADGYQHVNPLGDGQYLGLCGQLPSPEWTPACNAKVIGAYDFVTDLMADVHVYDPGAVNGPGPVDENGHGSHTASTALGNPVLAQVPGGPSVSISGVAPRANLVVYDACYTTGTGQGTCAYISLVGAINQAVADGVVDVINYSIGGGSDPWAEEPSQAMLDATDAGIFVATSAGNSGPSARSIEHLEPWAATVAATTHGRDAFMNSLSITGPAPVPAALVQMPITFPPSSAPLTAAIASQLAYDANDPLLCTPMEPGAFADQVVMIYRGTCTFVEKVLNAEAGNAAAVVLVNNVESALSPALDGTSIPVATMLLSQGDAIAAFVADAGSANVRLDYPSSATHSPADQMARFSGRGPGRLPLLKPDLAAPGANILAATHEQADAYSVLSGTSMAAPHVAGAAALVAAARPEWTPAEVKSALMLTSKTAGVTTDGNPAGVFDRGAGRIRADLAIGSGLVMDETSYRYLREDPDRGGNPTVLNVASIATDTCVEECTFTRTLRNVSDDAQTWNVTLSGIAGSVEPTVLPLAPGASGEVTVTMHVGDAPQDSYVTGEISLTPAATGDLLPLHMPVAAFVDPFGLELAPTAIAVTASAGSTTTASFSATNTGNAGLTWELLSGLHDVPVVNQPPNTLNGMVSSLYADLNNGSFVADDIVLDQPTTFRSLSVPGFLFAHYLDTVDMYADTLTWSLYADAGGKPDGHPGDGVEPLWSVTLPVDAPGVTQATNSLDIDLDAAGVTLTLQPGRYWLVAYPTFPSHAVHGVNVMWFQHILDTQSGAVAQALNNDPTFGGIPGSDVWEGIDNGWEGHYGAAMVGIAIRQCTPSWATASQTSGNVGAGQSHDVSITIDASTLAPGEHVGQLCVGSNDAAQPLTLIPVQLTVTP